MGSEGIEWAPLHAPVAPLSGRAQTALQQHQRGIAQLQRNLQSVDRVLSGALTACDAHSQNEMLSTYLESVQELRVALERLEGFLMQRLSKTVPSASARLR
jgi:ubiquinone biosynthesis protein UbiJ